MNIFDPFTENYTWLAFIIVAVLGIWFFGKRYSRWKSAVRNHSVTSALIDFIAAPIMILFLGSLTRTVLTPFTAVDLSSQILNVSLFSLLLAIAWCFARFDRK